MEARPTQLTAVGDHIKQHDHNIDISYVKIIGKEERFWNRKIREAIEMKTHTQPYTETKATSLWPYMPIYIDT